MTERLYLRLEGDATHGPESSAPADTLGALPVSPRLRKYVSQVIVYREQFACNAEVLERVLPDGAVRLVFNLADAPSANSDAGFRIEAVGACAAPAVVRLRGRIEGLSLVVRPGMASSVLGVPAAAIENRAVHLDDLWHGEGSQLLERLAEAPSDQARVTVIEAALLRRMQAIEDTGQGKAAHAARLMTESGGTATVSTLAATLGVGERRLQQLFRAHVGLSPRSWGRLSRLHACLRALRGQCAPSWADLAVSTGYYDQAHLANEFRALCGLSPTAFLRRTISQSSKTAE